MVKGKWDSTKNKVAILGFSCLVFLKNEIQPSGQVSSSMASVILLALL